MTFNGSDVYPSVWVLDSAARPASPPAENLIRPGEDRCTGVSRLDSNLGRGCSRTW
jgi:hypothetical protein